MSLYLDDGDVQLYHGDGLAVLHGLPAGIAQTCVTSPPYWGLRDYGAAGQLGLEATPTEYVENMVALFREVRRVLRDDGTLWLNLGDSYNSGSQFNHDKTGLDSAVRYSEGDGSTWPGHRGLVAGLKPKDLVGIPWRVAFALQADGWYLRSDIIWSKPNPMPESVTDRPTKSHEYVFLFSKQPRYFYDADAIREPHSDTQGLDRFQTSGGSASPSNGHQGWVDGGGFTMKPGGRDYNPAGRNRRSVWTIPTEPFPEAHFATYPQALVTPCIQAGTSERGECVECGAPWRRLTQTTYTSGGNGGSHGKIGDAHRDPQQRTDLPTQRMTRQDETIGWEPTCSCVDSHGLRTPASPQIVLDPFVGSGTTALVARKHGRRCIGIDLSTDYLKIAAKRTQQLSLLGTEP